MIDRRNGDSARNATSGDRGRVATLGVPQNPNNYGLDALRNLLHTLHESVPHAL